MGGGERGEFQSVFRPFLVFLKRTKKSRTIREEDGALLSEHLRVKQPATDPPLSPILFPALPHPFRPFALKDGKITSGQMALKEAVREEDEGSDHEEKLSKTLRYPHTCSERSEIREKSICWSAICRLALFISFHLCTMSPTAAAPCVCR